MKFISLQEQNYLRWPSCEDFNALLILHIQPDPPQATHEQKCEQGANRNRCHPAQPLVGTELPCRYVRKHLQCACMTARIPCASRSNKGSGLWATALGTSSSCFPDHTFHLATQGLDVVLELH